MYRIYSADVSAGLRPVLVHREDDYALNFLSRRCVISRIVRIKEPVQDNLRALERPEAPEMD